MNFLSVFSSQCFLFLLAWEWSFKAESLGGPQGSPAQHRLHPTHGRETSLSPRALEVLRCSRPAGGSGPPCCCLGYVPRCLPSDILRGCFCWCVFEARLGQGSAYLWLSLGSTQDISGIFLAHNQTNHSAPPPHTKKKEKKRNKCLGLYVWSKRTKVGSDICFCEFVQVGRILLTARGAWTDACARLILLHGKLPISLGLRLLPELVSQLGEVSGCCHLESGWGKAAKPLGLAFSISSSL